VRAPVNFGAKQERAVHASPMRSRGAGSGYHGPAREAHHVEAVAVSNPLNHALDLHRGPLAAARECRPDRLFRIVRRSDKPEKGGSNEEQRADDNALTDAHRQSAKK
jgi:hypothetical protein